MGIEKIYLDPTAEANVGEEFSETEQTKLAGIETGAEVNPASLAELDATASAKLDTIEEGALRVGIWG